MSVDIGKFKLVCLKCGSENVTIACYDRKRWIEIEINCNNKSCGNKKEWVDD